MWTGILIEEKGSLFKNSLSELRLHKSFTKYIFMLCYGGHNLLSTPGYKVESIVKCYTVY